MGKGCSKENAITINDEMDKILTEADYKMRLEQKICTFKETPEPICDLSECNLDKLPGNSLFSMIKVLRKEILILGKNRLKSLSSGGQLSELELLQVLDLSHNKFKVIPIEICVVKNLKVSHQVLSIGSYLEGRVNFTLISGTFSVEQLFNSFAINNQPTQEAGTARCLQQQPVRHPSDLVHD